MSLLKEMVDPKYTTKAYQIKFGNAVVTPQGEAKIESSQLMKKLKDCLESSPLITGVHEVSVPGDAAHKYISCDINLPPKNQKVGKIIESVASPATLDWTSKFTLTYDGTIYIVLREINLSKDAYPGAEDVRDLLLETLRKEKSWKLSNTGPNPLREELILVFLAESKETVGFLGKSFEGEEKKRTYFYLSEKSLQEFDLLQAMLMRSENLSLRFFYEAAAEHAKVGSPGASSGALC